MAVTSAPVSNLKCVSRSFNVNVANRTESLFSCDHVQERRIKQALTRDFQNLLSEALGVVVAFLAPMAGRLLRGAFVPGMRTLPAASARLNGRIFCFAVAVPICASSVPFP